MPESLVVLLLLTPLLGALACALPGFQAEIRPLSAAAGLLIVGFAVLLAARTTGATTHTGIGGVVLVDALSGVLILAVGVIGAAALICAPAMALPRQSVPGVAARSLADARRDAGEDAHASSYALIHLSLASMLLTLMAANLLVLWLGLALSTVLAARMAGGQPIGTSRADIRRLAVLGAGLALALAAILLLALAAAPHLGEVSATLDWPSLRAMRAHIEPGPARAAYLLALLGFGSLCTVIAPLAWLPAALRRTPMPAAALIQMGLPICALYGLLRCQAIAAPALGGAIIPHLLLAAALLALIPIATAVAAERALPCLVAQAGSAQIALAAAAFGLGTAEGATAGGLALVGYALTASTAMPAVGAACAVMHTRRALRVGVGLRDHPLLAALAIGGLLALGGLPPSAAFLGAIAVLDAAVRAAPAAGAALLAGWAVVAIGLAVQAGRLVRAATRQPPGSPLGSGRRLWPLALPAVALLLLGIHVPDGLSVLLRQAAAVVGDGP